MFVSFLPMWQGDQIDTCDVFVFCESFLHFDRTTAEWISYGCEISFI